MTVYMRHTNGAPAQVRGPVRALGPAVNRLVSVGVHGE